MKYLLTVLLLASNVAYAETPCDEWANFSKIIAYKWRDIYSAEEVEKEVRKANGQDPEIELAVFWVRFVYANKALTPVDTWKEVYKLCNSKATM